MESKKLNFGCGKIIKPQNKGWINVDIQKAEGIDKSFNFEKFPYPLENDSFSYILADNVLEHLDNLGRVVDELWRISTKDAIIEIIVPHNKSKYAWGDITHKHFFDEASIRDLFEEKVYSYEQETRFKIISVELKPSIPLGFVPDVLRRILSRYLNNIYSTIAIKAGF